MPSTEDDIKAGTFRGVCVGGGGDSYKGLVITQSFMRSLLMCYFWGNLSHSFH